MPTLRLSHQLGLAVTGLLLVVGALVGWNLIVTRQLTDAHRNLVDEGLPAVRLEIGLLEHVAGLQRMEGRYTILKDPAFLAMFRDRVRSARSSCGRRGPASASTVSSWRGSSSPPGVFIRR